MELIVIIAILLLAVSPTWAAPPYNPLTRNLPYTNRTRFAGVNLAGFDFGWSVKPFPELTSPLSLPSQLTSPSLSTTNGVCYLAAISPPLLTQPTLTTGPQTKNAFTQLTHFTTSNNLNLFRLPISWQYLTSATLFGALHLGTYDTLVRACLSSSPTTYCMLDLHNYARYSGVQITPYGLPSTTQFANLWGAIAAHYANESRVWFGLMNEPHDLSGLWAPTLQAAVTAIREAGAKTQFISLPGSGWQSPGALMYGESLDGIRDWDGSTSKLVFDVHLYLDATGAGTGSECVTDGIPGSWRPLAGWLRARERQAIVSETGGGGTESCARFVCRELAFLE